MRLRADWSTHLRRTNAREIDLAFGRCPDSAFRTALELGAGDGFQARLLRRYSDRLVSTDLNPSILDAAPFDGVEYALCDAEEVGETFAPGAFDLIWASTMLEHLPDPDRGLQEMHRVLKNDGIMVHTVPSPTARVVLSALHHIDIGLMVIEAATEPAGRAWLRSRFLKQEYRPPVPLSVNIKSTVPRPPLWQRVLIPHPHGVSPRARDEMNAWKRECWRAQFERNGWRVVSVRSAGFGSGYGFGAYWLTDRLERCGIATGYIIAAVKQGHESPHEAYFS